MIRAEYRDLDELLDDFRDLPRHLMPEVEKVVSKGALNIKGGWADRWEGHSTIAHLPRAINYDMATEGLAVEAEIGPAHERTQGVLAHIIEFGDLEYGNLRNAPIPGGKPALDEEEPKFVRNMGDVGEKVLRRRGS